MISSVSASAQLPSALSHRIGPQSSVETKSAETFEAMMKKLASTTIDTLKDAEGAATAGVRGQVPIQEVVASIMPAEQALQAAISIRDKVVAAYLDLTKMAI